MFDLLCVGAGGFIGSVGRYLLSLWPVDGDLPLATLLTNFIGAVVIGFVAQLAGSLASGMPPRLVLFLKTGLCGGFTTFSTFSLETFNLIGAGKAGLAAGYAGASVASCVAGVGLGMWLGGLCAARLNA